jgi:HEAT repeat protein
VEPLVRALHDEFFSVADQAAYALGSLGDARAVEPLVQALNGPHEETGRGCHEGQAQAGEIRV